MKLLSIYDIEELTIFADEIIHQLRYCATEYDDNGVCLWDVFKDVEDSQSRSQLVINRIKEQEKYCGEDGDFLLDRIVHEEISIDSAIGDTAEGLLEQIEPIKNKVLGMFRNGVHDLDYIVSSDVPDEYLLNFFAMRIRDRRILMAAQRDYCLKGD